MSAPRGDRSATGKGGSKKQRYGGGGKAYQSQRPVEGPGIFITCVRGKEGRCVGEMYDLLDETANRIYPAERLAELEKTRIIKPSYLPEGEEGTEAASPVAEESSDSEDEDESIEDQIARELREMAQVKAGTITAHKKAKKVEGSPKVKRVRPRFESLVTNTDCLVFMSIAWPYDPVELAEAMVMEVQETGVSRTRYTRRLEPVSITCGALSSEIISKQSLALIEKTFHEWAVKNNTTTITKLSENAFDLSPLLSLLSQPPTLPPTLPPPPLPPPLLPDHSYKSPAI
ncbi:tRNA acetyltransferase TAN1, partial [Phenoliferia sp. Uapishka_3]